MSVIFSKKIIFSSLITLLFIVFVAKFINFDEFLLRMRAVNLGFLLLAAVTYFLSFLLRAERLKDLFNKKGQKLTLMSISALHNFYNKVLPFKTGELTLPFFLKKYLQIEYAYGLGGLVLFRFLDIFALILLFLVSNLFLGQSVEGFNIADYKIYLLIMVFSQLMVLVYLKKITIIFLRSNKYYDKILPNKFSRPLHDFFVKMSEQAKKDNWHLLIAKASILSILTWLLLYGVYFWILKGFGFEVTFFQTIWASTLVTVIQHLPINGIGRIGTFELGWAVGFIALGFDKDVVIPIAIFVNLFGLGLNGIFALVGHFYLQLYNRSTGEINAFEKP